MTSKTHEKIKREIKQELIKEFVLPLLRNIKDAEGGYKEKFVKEVLKATRETPKHTYNSKTFLSQIS